MLAVGSPHHLDYGYAVTSPSSQGQTADRVLVHIDTQRASDVLVNQRLAYVAISRGRHDAQIYRDNTQPLTRSIAQERGLSAALENSPMPASKNAHLAQSRAKTREVEPHLGFGAGI